MASLRENPTVHIFTNAYNGIGPKSSLHENRASCYLLLSASLRITQRFLEQNATQRYAGRVSTVCWFHFLPASEIHQRLRLDDRELEVLRTLALVLSYVLQPQFGDCVTPHIHIHGNGDEKSMLLQRL